MSSDVTTCEESYEMTKRQLDDIQWQESFLKHETPSTKMEAERTDLSCTEVPVYFLCNCLFGTNVNSEFWKTAKISYNWALTGEFLDSFLVKTLEGFFSVQIEVQLWK